MIELLRTPPPFIRRYGGSWGVFVLALWAITLSLTALTNLWLALSADNHTWVIVVFNAVLAIAFWGAAWGLIQRQNWGRVLFLWLITLWSGANLIALFAVPNLDTITLIFNSLRFLLGLALPLGYLNLAHIKLIFKDITHHDNDFTSS